MYEVYLIPLSKAPNSIQILTKPKTKVGVYRTLETAVEVSMEKMTLSLIISYKFEQETNNEQKLIIISLAGNRTQVSCELVDKQR